MSQITLSALFHFPIKSCAGQYDVFLKLGPRGPVGDRLFMVTDEHYRFRTQRKEQGGFTKMVHIVLHGEGPIMTLRAPGTLPCIFDVRRSSSLATNVTVFDDVCRAVDQGESVAEWLTEYLGVPSRLVRMTDDHVRPVDQTFCEGEPARTGFADAFPILLISDASLADLNERLLKQGREPVDRINFRAALWVRGCDPYEEDTWKRIRINGIEFDVVKPCARCSITTVDVKTGTYRADHEPLITLNRYRQQTIAKTGKKGVMFGQNVIHRGVGTVRVGSEVEILERH